MTQLLMNTHVGASIGLFLLAAALVAFSASA